jgi:hypothetical protein
VIGNLAATVTWDDPDARRWSARLKPLTGAITEAFLAWLTKSTYPSRRGEHSNTAFGLRRSLDFARRRAAAGEPALLAAVAELAHTSGSDYMVEHWLAAYAVLYLT